MLINSLNGNSSEEFHMSSDAMTSIVNFSLLCDFETCIKSGTSYLKNQQQWFKISNTWLLIYHLIILDFRQEYMAELPTIHVFKSVVTRSLNWTVLMLACAMTTI